MTFGRSGGSPPEEESPLVDDWSLVPADGPMTRFTDAGGTAPEDRAFRPDIEGMRAVSVLAVVVYHANILHFIGGYIGVDVFFVISGFVITGVLLRNHTASGRPQILEFYGRRVLRIVPMATLVIAVSITAERVLFGKAVAAVLAADARWAALFLANIHGSLFMGPYWSLGVEEQFYLVYPVVVLVVASVFRQWSLRARLGMVLGAIIVASFSWAALNPAAAYGSAFGRSWELAVGALLAVTTGYFKKMPASLAAVMTWVGLVGLVSLVFVLRFEPSYAGRTAVLPVGAAALMIAGGSAAPRAGAEALLRLSPFKWLGRWSYSLYLWHWTALFVAEEHWGNHGSDVARGAVVGVAVVLSAVTYFCVENPIRHSTRLKEHPVASIAFGLTLVVACLAVISLAS